MTTEAAFKIRTAIDTIEEAYEFMLAYAAQGRKVESDTDGASQIRSYLERFRSAVEVISSTFSELGNNNSDSKPYIEHLLADAKVMKSVLSILISRENITSDMIDNTNGMIAVRSFLTDLFYLDQVLLPSRESKQ